MTGARDELVRSYGEIAYPFLSHHHTDPDRLATIARLHGIPAPAVERASVLEVGCAGGGNLAAMAMALPDAHLVGIDLSERQVARGRAAIAAAGISNVRLHALDLMDLGTTLGTFDYIIAHGVFSWVSRDAQDELLSAVARCLSPNGVAYVSYNTRPGWHELSVIRDGLVFDVRGIAEPRERIQRARAYLAWLTRSIPSGGPFGKRFIDEVEKMRALDDSGLLHEFLGPFHMPIHFEKIVARAARYGLWYLCDAEPALSADHSVLPEADLARQRSPDELVFAEQYYDFLSNRKFRRSLFCRRGTGLTRSIAAELVDHMFVSSRGMPDDEAAASDFEGGASVSFRVADSALATEDPLLKAALLHLASVSPRAIAFLELVEGVRLRLGSKPLSERDIDDLRRNVLHAFLSSVGVVMLRTHAPPCVNEPGERPVASSWARQLARETDLVATLDLDMVRIDGVVRRLLPLLDGTRDRPALEAELAGMVERGEIVVKLPDGRPGQPAPGAMDQMLRGLARSALLVA